MPARGFQTLCAHHFPAKHRLVIPQSYYAPQGMPLMRTRGLDRYRTRFRVSAIDVESMDEKYFADLHVAGPIVFVTPQNIMFRKPVKIAIPHHAASIENLVLLHSPFPSDGSCEWVPMDSVSFSTTHAHTILESFTSFFVVVHRGQNIPDDLVFCIPQAIDGRALQHLHLSRGERWVGQVLRSDSIADAACHFVSRGLESK